MLTVCIQAGGQSRRMGRDKALLPFLGQPLIARVAARLVDIADELYVTAPNEMAYAFLGLRCIADAVPGLGALGGLATALRGARCPWVAVVACDMPWVQPALLSAMAAQAQSEQWDVLIPRLSAGFEPFHAIYRREACLSHVEEALAAGERKASAWFQSPSAASLRVRVLESAEISPFDPQFRSFLNLNTPAEWRAAEDLARSGLDTAP